MRFSSIATALWFVVFTATMSASSKAESLTPGWSGTVSSHYTDDYTYGEGGHVVRTNSGSLSLDGTSSNGDGTLAYRQAYLDTVPCLGGGGTARVTQDASGTAFSHGGLAPIGFDGDGSYAISIGGDALFDYVETIQDCGGSSSGTTQSGPYLPATAPCPGHPAPKIPSGWDGVGLSGADHCTAQSSTQKQTYDIQWRLTRLPDRDHDGFADASDGCPDDPALPDSANGCPAGKTPTDPGGAKNPPGDAPTPVSGKPGCFKYDAGHGYSYVLCEPTKKTPIDLDDSDRSLFGDPIENQIQEAQEKVDLADEAVKQAEDGLAACEDLTIGIATGFIDPWLAAMAVDWKGDGCVGGIINNVSNAVQEALDPPDPRYRAVAIPSTPARPNLNRDCRVGDRDECLHLADLLSRFLQADGRAGAITLARGLTTNRYGAAVANGDAIDAFLQRTAYRVLGGQLARTLRERRSLWLSVAGFLRRHGTSLSVSRESSAHYTKSLKTGRGIPAAVFHIALRSGLMETRAQVFEALRRTAARLGKPHRTDVLALFSRSPSTKALSAEGRSVGIFGAHVLAASFAKSKKAYTALDKALQGVVSACSRAARGRAVQALDREAKSQLTKRQCQFLAAAVEHFSSARPHC
jgi:hypothetical protein